MIAAPDPRVLTPALMKFVYLKAAALAGRYGFSRSDRDDIRQDLLLDCIARSPNFDPARSSPVTFFHRVILHGIATLLEAQRAGCRDYRRCRHSLNTPVQFNDESIELGETISVDDYDYRLGRSVLPPLERTELQIDVALSISRLPAELTAVAVLLKTVSVVEAARRLGVSRSTLCRRVASIREIFIAAGLDGYHSRHRFKQLAADVARPQAPTENTNISRTLI
jgi:RNA polymerase sigma-70 factor, ECF subfamily